MSCLIRIFAVCKFNLFFITINKISNKQGRCPILADRWNLPDFTLVDFGSISSQAKDKVRKGAKIRNRYNQVPHLTQDTNGKVTNSQKAQQTRAKRCN